MPSASTLSAYLAKNYLTADTPSSSDKKSKKRKRHTTTTSSLTIADDSGDTWGATSTKTSHAEEDTPAPISHSGSAEFRRAKTSQWQTLSGAPATLSATNEARTTDEAANAAEADAEAIIRSAADEQSARVAAEQDDPDEAPAVLDTQVMSNGAHAGLQSASAMAAQMASYRAREDADTGNTQSGKGETIYRDASGRIVNIAMKRAEARAAAEAAEEKKRKEIEAARGDVQRVQREERRQELEDAKLMPFARGVDDEDMNAELRAKDVWGDPMAGQLSSTVTKGKGEKRSKPVVKTSSTGRPLYAGSAPPNRYGIRPGHKWDGVDRATGFESEWFKARNTRKDRQALEWNWQMDE